jgi:uncharacterized protein (TIGR02996 family)
MPMSDVAALLAAIRAAPDDDAPRLVYADWLDEHGQPERAEFIRLQIELARKESPKLRRRETELLAEHHDALAGNLAMDGVRFRFHRGFIVAFGETTILAADDPDRPGGSLLYVFRSTGTWHTVSYGTRIRNARKLTDMIRECGSVAFCVFKESNYRIDPLVDPVLIEFSTRSRVFRGRFNGSEFVLEHPSTKRKRVTLQCTRVDFPDFESFLELEG